MIVSTTSTVPGYEVTEILGLVRGNTIRARHLGKDVMAALRNVVGGEIAEGRDAGVRHGRPAGEDLTTR